MVKIIVSFAALVLAVSAKIPQLQCGPNQPVNKIGASVDLDGPPEYMATINGVGEWKKPKKQSEVNQDLRHFLGLVSLRANLHPVLRMCTVAYTKWCTGCLRLLAIMTSNAHLSIVFFFPTNLPPLTPYPNPNTTLHHRQEMRPRQTHLPSQQTWRWRHPRYRAPLRTWWSSSLETARGPSVCQLVLFQYYECFLDLFISQRFGSAAHHTQQRACISFLYPSHAAACVHFFSFLWKAALSGVFDTFTRALNGVIIINILQFSLCFFKALRRYLSIN